VRFLAAAFPLILPLAGWLRERGRESLLGVVVGVEASLLVGFTMMHLLATLAFP
jgi:biotin transporter BioY